MRTPKKAAILYLDDEAMCLEVFKQTFEDDYDVRVVSTPTEARAALSESKFDIVMSDQLMAEIEGVIFLREVAETHPDAFRIMLTGSISLGQVISEISGGIIHLFVTKPWTEPEMRQALERAIVHQDDPTRTPAGVNRTAA